MTRKTTRQPRPRGRPPKEMTGAEFLRRFGHKTLVWCDENGEPTSDQTIPTGYVRALTKAEAQCVQVEEILAACPDFERCTPRSTPDPTGTHWKLRDSV